MEPLSQDFEAFFTPDANEVEFADPQVDNTLKNLSRIAAIRATMTARKTLVLYTPFACRHLRRDFNIASAKMYVYGLDRSYKKEISDAIATLQFAVSLLEMDVAPWTNMPNVLAPRSFELLLVSAESTRMMRVLQAVDRCMTGVYSALINGDMTRPERDNLLRPFLISYLNFKRVAMKLELDGTAQELVDEMR